MKTDDLRNVLQALRTAPHEFIGVTPLPLNPPKSPPAVLILDHNADGFTRSTGLAGETWPDAQQFALIGGNVLMPPIDDADAIDNIQRIEDPEQLATFSTAV